MDERTLTALKGSIKKWEDIVAGTGTDAGASNCPLCEQFHHNGCVGCPVLEATGRWQCQDTPYVDWNDAHDRDIYVGTEGDPEKTRLAQAELDFLKSLLPKEEDNGSANA